MRQSIKIKPQNYNEIKNIKEENKLRTLDETVEFLLNFYYEKNDYESNKSKLNLIIKYLEEDREINNLYLNYTDSLDEELRGKTHRMIEVGIEEREEKRKIKKHYNGMKKKF